MPQLSELTDAPATVDDNELLYVRLPSGSPVSRKRRASTLISYVLGANAQALRGFYGAVPIAQPSAAEQAAWVTTYGGTVSVTATAVSGTAGATYTATEQGLINSLVTQLNALRTDVSNTQTLVNELRTDMGKGNTLLTAIRTALVSLGLIKGSA